MIWRRIFRFSGLALAVLALAVACQDLRNGGQETLAPPPDGTLRLATLNVHYIDMRADGGRWSQAGWDARKEPLDAAFKAVDADLFAF